MTVITLGVSLDTAAAGALHQELLTRFDTRQPLLLDGSDVVRAGQAGLQLLVAARAAAAAAGLPYTLANPSTALTEMASLAKLDVVLDPLG